MFSSSAPVGLDPLVHLYSHHIKEEPQFLSVFLFESCFADYSSSVGAIVIESHNEGLAGQSDTGRIELKLLR